MKVSDVEKRVEAIRNGSADDKTAHADEDLLYYDVLKSIAFGAKNAQELARAALQTKKIGFERWYA